MSSKAEREQRLVEWAARVRARGEFVHLDKRRPRLASADYVPPGTLRALVDRGVLVPVQSDLFGYPLQYATKRMSRRIGR